MRSGPHVPRGAIAVALGLALGAALLGGVDEGRSSSRPPVACYAPPTTESVFARTPTNCR